MTTLAVPRNQKTEKTTTPKEDLSAIIKQSWEIISPFWPLKNLIAVNPLQGFENLPIEEALRKSASYFQQTDFPLELLSINKETIKWIQVYFDEKQAAIPMPFKDEGLYTSWKKLAIFDTSLHQNDPNKIHWIKTLPNQSEEALEQTLQYLKIPNNEKKEFLAILLATLPGWASYAKYQAFWNIQPSFLGIETDYLCVRSIIASLIWPQCKSLLSWQKKQTKNLKDKNSILHLIEKKEEKYRSFILKNLAKQNCRTKKEPKAQLVFCIDVRSEPMRRAIEAIDAYETFGIAGFFSVPVEIKNKTSNTKYNSCPILLNPKHRVEIYPTCQKKYQKEKRKHEILRVVKNVYESVKYNFVTPFPLAESIGILSGAWMLARTLTPLIPIKYKRKLTNCIKNALSYSLEELSLEDQCSYAENTLKTIGLTNNFAPIVVFCGHGSTTKNNPYGSSLDCGACGGNQGENNAAILATILNQEQVRAFLETKHIFIPTTTKFIAARHDTTKNEVILQAPLASASMKKLQIDLRKAQKGKTNKSYSNWSEVRPEWGLAKNATFIIAPRSLTECLDLEGRCFLHSYEPTKDPEGNSLRSILTAPMVVAQWINAQYLFSTLDNICFGSGSKITHNITGGLGIMQGNASDLMTGLPLQSVFSEDEKPYHETQRLLTIVYGSKKIIDNIIQQEKILQKLFGNGWVHLSCIDPQSGCVFILQRDFTWKELYLN